MVFSADNFIVAIENPASGVTMKKFASHLIVGLIAGIVVWFISFQTIILDDLERRLKDGYFRFKEFDVQELVKKSVGNPRIADVVQLIAVDDQSLGSLGKWPWYRDVHATYLNTIEQFSPQSVFFDIAFVMPERIPPSIGERISGNPAIAKDIEEAFSSMDNSFAEALSRYDNVFIDLFLVGEERPDISYLDRIRFTEETMENYSLPAPDDIDVQYRSLEPLVEGFQAAAHPVTVDQWPDSDEVLRNFMVCHQYATTDGEKRYYFSVLLSLLKRYYHINSNSQVLIEDDRVILHNAKAPVVGEDKHPKIHYDENFTELQRIIDDSSVQDAYNTNLYNYIVTQHSYLYPDEPEKKPPFPIHLLEKANGHYELIDGKEIYDAATRLGSTKISVIYYRRQDITIFTEKNFVGVPHMFPINFAGSEEYPYTMADTGERKTFYTVPTKSYVDVYNIGLLPEIPAVDHLGQPAVTDPQALLAWFKSYTEYKYDNILRTCQDTYGELSLEILLNYVRQDDPFEGRYFYYKLFFDAMAELVLAGELKDDPDLASCVELYPQWLEMNEWQQDPVMRLTEKNVIEALHEIYRHNFHKFYNKMIFTGAYSKGMADDIKVTPLGNMFGVNLITHGFSTIVVDNQLTRSTPTLNTALVFLICLFFSLAYGPINIKIGAYFFVFSFITTFLASYWFFLEDNYLLRTIPLVFANIIVFGTITVIKVLTEERDKRFLKNTFSQYISPELIEIMYESKATPQLGGSSGIITAYFTDIQSFSTFSEKLTATQLVELLNEYLTAMTDALLAEQGTLDKYEGDAIIAFFGAPMRVPDHAYRACKVAVTMQNTLIELRRKWQQETAGGGRNTKNLPPEEWAPDAKWPGIVHEMKMRIGINTGEIVTGNMGSATRMNYTMMGDSVNLAARLEAGAKQYGVYSMMSEFSYGNTFEDDSGNHLKVADLIEVRFIDNIMVVGKSEPVKVYELICLKGDLTEKERRLIEIFNQAMEYYLAMAWDVAIEKFNESLAIERFPEGKTTPSAVYIKRCRQFKENPPVPAGEKWDGVYRLTSK